ncbi:CoA carboxylase [Aureococcus anophagefferens]|nr:CoA carboxylase [Aureococcus anophagefferens]
MKRLFIANRGEIAARIARTARDRALPSVVAVAPEDEQLVAQYHCDATAPLRSAASYADSDELIAAALREGCDAARAGGGGRGIRRVSLGGDLAADFERCASEASRSFGGAEEGLLVEDHVWSARHVEVQVAADNCGAVATLFDRECSLQRRHQKLIEVAPAPFLDDTLRRLIAEAAKALAASSGLQGLGTFEFLINGDRFYFMECNPRLQVEHTVTEEIAGVDLVAVQLALAQGAALDDALRGRAAAPRGFSVQARVLAEKNGKPSCEPARRFSPPTNGVRVETALAEVLGATATTTFVDDAFPDDEAAALADDGEAAALADDSDGALRSPTAGTVVSVAAVGEIARGKPVVVIEAMKMEHVLAAPADGEVVAVRCAVGDVVSEGSVLAEVAVAAGAEAAAAEAAETREELAAKTPADGVLTGVGMVGAAPAVVVAVADGPRRYPGFFHHHKLDRAVQVAAKRRLPIIALPEGGGGRPNDGDVEGLMAAGLFISTWHACAARGRRARVAVVSGYCFAGSAAIAGCSDVVIATGRLARHGRPAMIEGGGLGRVKPEGGPSAAGGDQRLLRRLVPENRKRAYDMRAILDVVCDEGSVFELRDRFGRSVITALARVDGRAVGILASDPARNGGAVDADAADKAARFLRLCDAFGLPVVSLLDCPGFMVGPDAERDGMVRKASRLFLAGAKLSVPVVAVVVRKAVGLGAMALCGGSTKVPVDTLAFPTAEIGAMGVEGAVNLGFKAKLDAVDGDERAALFDKLCAAVHARGAATTAASQLEVAAGVDPAETRDRIVAALAGYEPPPPGRGLDAW